MSSSRALLDEALPVVARPRPLGTEGEGRLGLETSPSRALLEEGLAVVERPRPLGTEGEGRPRLGVGLSDSLFFATGFFLGRFAELFERDGVPRRFAAIDRSLQEQTLGGKKQSPRPDLGRLNQDYQIGLEVLRVSTRAILG